MNSKQGIFVSTPISGFEDIEAYQNYRSKVLKLIEVLKMRFTICSEIELIDSIDSYDSPVKSVKEDFLSIKNNEIFLFLHPTRMQSSSLIEFGYACAFNKKIVIVAKKSDLPFLAIGYVDFAKNVAIVENEHFDEGIFDDIVRAIDRVNG